MIKTRITEMFGVETPLVMGGMTGKRAFAACEQ